MADGTKLNADVSGWIAGLDRLKGPARVSLARSMAVAGGEVLRDEAKLLAARSEQSGPRTGGGVPLSEAIYLAFNEGRSTDSMVQYAISWNARKAPHGHLKEFGHWQPYVVRRLPDGRYITDKRKLRSGGPKWVSAHPFLRPALAVIDRARAAMIARGRVRLPEILAAQANEDQPT